MVGGFSKIFFTAFVVLDVILLLFTGNLKTCPLLTHMRVKVIAYLELLQPFGKKVEVTKIQPKYNNNYLIIIDVIMFTFLKEKDELIFNFLFSTHV